MKSKIKNKIKSKLQHIGLFVQLIPETKIQYFPTAKSLYQYLLKQPENKRITEFLRLTDFIANAKNHNYYQQLLKEIHPEIPDNFEESVFVLKKSRFSSNRKIKWKNKFYFEKNYLFIGHELETVLWFKENLYTLISQQFRVPKLHQVYKADFCCLTYWEYLNLQPLDFPQEESIQLSKDLYTFSLKNHQKLKALAWPKTLLNYDKLYLTKNIEKAKNIFNNNGVDFSKIQTKVENSTLILAHADLHIENVFKQNTLIDLDNFGFYPMGVDVAYLYDYFEVEKQPQKRTAFKNWIEKNYKAAIQEKDWPDFKRNSAYFTFLNLIMRPDAHTFKELKKELFQVIIN